ncbi:MAG: DUF2490 domain-containing protein [Acidobacteria bacterium]|nr:DUF2490 domain-containing protein [Acidobacteriota bacterium]
MKRLVPAFFLIALCVFGVRAQLITDDNDVQSWNDVQLTAPLGKNFDFYTAVTMRFGKNVSRLNDGRFALGLVWKPTKALSIMPFYWYIDARNSRSQFRVEHRFSLRATYRFPIKKFGLTHRSTYEYRMRTPSSWRYRAGLTFEKELPKKFLPQAKFFFGDEVFYDSATGRFSRNRFSIGVNKTLNKHLAVDVYYMRQNDGFSHPGDLNTVWVTWRVKL